MNAPFLGAVGSYQLAVRLKFSLSETFYFLTEDKHGHTKYWIYFIKLLWSREVKSEQLVAPGSSLIHIISAHCEAFCHSEVLHSVHLWTPHATLGPCRLTKEFLFSLPMLLITVFNPFYFLSPNLVKTTKTHYESMFLLNRCSSSHTYFITGLLSYPPRPDNSVFIASSLCWF